MKKTKALKSNVKKATDVKKSKIEIIDSKPKKAVVSKNVLAQFFKNVVKPKDNIFQSMLRLQRSVLSNKVTPPIPHIITVENTSDSELNEVNVFQGLYDFYKKKYWNNGIFQKDGVVISLENNNQLQNYEQFLEWIMCKPISIYNITISGINPKKSGFERVHIFETADYRGSVKGSMYYFTESRITAIGKKAFKFNKSLPLDMNTKFTFPKLLPKQKIVIEFHPLNHCPYLNEMDFNEVLKNSTELHELLLSYKNAFSK